MAKYYDFIGVMPLAIYAPLIAKEQVKDMDELQTIIKSLIEVEIARQACSRDKSTIWNRKMRSIGEIIVRSLGQGAMINRHGEDAQPAPLKSAFLEPPMEMLDEFAFLGEDLARKIVIENTNALADL